MEKYIVGSVIVLLFALLCLVGSVAAEESGTVLTDDIEPYNGPVGADSPLYGLKLALEDMDESFTANETERVDKQMKHGRLRLSEVRRSLELNQSESAEEALNNYWQKMDLANVTLSKWSSNATGLLHAQEQIVKHQYVLENLLASHPNNTGLQRAYNNSLRLEDRFAEKTEVKYQRTLDKNNQTIMKAIRLEEKEHNRIGWPDATTTVTTTQPDEKLKGYEKDKGKGSGNGNPVTTVPTQVTTTDPQQGQGKGQDNQPDDRQTGNAGGNSGNQGKGNSKNK